ncbi:methyl-CpG-binding domain-containing protein [Ranunculus cassubicifolius]
MQSQDGDVSAGVKEEEESHLTYDSPEIKVEKDAFADSSHPNHTEDTLGQSSDDDDDDEVEIVEKGDDGVNNNALVIYNPEANGAVSDPLPTQMPMTQSPVTPRVLPSVGAFTVQCANCFKWRLIPTKEKYEAIRENILQIPFICNTAREWRPDISCADDADIHQDGSRLWAIDKPNIAQPPPGWDRILRIRGEGSTKFADVYYAAPTGKKLRSMVEINKFLSEHPEYADVNATQFSFQIPKPLQENYVRKRPSRAELLNAARPLEPTEVNPLSWAGPATDPHLQLGQAETSTRYDAEDTPPTVTPSPPAKKRRTKSPFKKATKSPLSSNHHSYNDDNITTPEINSTYPENNGGAAAAHE